MVIGRKWFAILCLSVLILSACNDSDTTDGLRWGACSDYYFLDPTAQCLTVEAPLDYEGDQQRTIQLSMFRYMGAAEAKEGQVWFLEGGPGGSGRLLSRAMIRLAEYYPDFDYYSLDHRGVGYSTRFGCPGDNDIGDDWDAYRNCLDQLKLTWGDDIRHFSTTNAARDLHHAISINREKGKKVFIWATSYGTYWLLRYLQLYPDEVDGVIVDSICTPGSCYLDNYDEWNNLVGGQFLDLCQADPVCNAKMTSIAQDPNQAMAAVFAKIDQGTLPAGCNSLFTRESLRHTLAPMLNNWATRVLVPPLIYRLNRCNADDQNVMAYFLETLKGGGADRTILNSPMLCDLISLSELYSGNTSAQLEQFLEGAHFSEDVSLRFAEIYEAQFWTLYNDPDHAQILPQTDIPMLMLNGTTDPQTPLEIAGLMQQHFTGANQQFVTVPFSTHGVLVNSPVTIPSWLFDGYDQTCGSLLFGQFIHNPKGTLDTSCLDNVYPVDFDPATDNNKMISLKNFGTGDMWEGAVNEPAGNLSEQTTHDVASW